MISSSTFTLKQKIIELEENIEEFDFSNRRKNKLLSLFERYKTTGKLATREQSYLDELFNILLTNTLYD